ncbi:hypothetical protein COLO4_16742 [Corchorus olitorius]|uniref:Uncharacterized protein n=1 Tax=Corchorus olitorius TaxID=93759 RepID=A0A1R3JFW8_9ROSI|nr:hypothetical protein COLO4_16742 [Corchorus olitorius]
MFVAEIELQAELQICCNCLIFELIAVFIAIICKLA